MHIVIDISEDDYRKVQDGRASVSMMRKAIRNGTPLPKGHGRLIDVDVLNRKDVNCANVPMNFIDIAPPIIEADKGYNDALKHAHCLNCGKKWLSHRKGDEE